MKKTCLLIIVLLVLTATCFVLFFTTNNIANAYQYSDTVTLRPDNNGTYTECTASGDTYNWQCVDEVICDDDSTYVHAPNLDRERTDTYSITNPTAINDTVIDSVIVYFTVRQEDDGSTNCYTVIYSNGSLYEQSPDVSVYVYYTEKSYTWETNPGNNSNKWTWDDINNLEIGCHLKGYYATRSTQVYAIVSYTGNSTNITVTTDETILVEETTATLSGSVTGPDNVTCGFWYNTTTTNASNYGTNVTCTGTFDRGETFTEAITGLTSGEYYYVRAWASEAGVGFFNDTSETYFLTKPDIPLNLSTGDTVTASNFSISWDNASVGSGTNRTAYICYSTSAYPTSRTEGTYLYNDTGNSTVLTNWDRDTTYYFSAWHYVNDTGSSLKSQFSDTYNTSSYTTPTKPISLTVTDYNDTRITLTWSKGTGDTVIVRNTTDPNNATDGTEVYNGTAQTYTDTGLTPDTCYYYRAYDWNGTGYSTFYNSTNQYTTPQPPQNVTSETTVIDGTTMDLNISWVNGTGSDVTLVRRSATTQPLLVTDGTEIYNSSMNFTIDSSITTVYYYTLWSYSNTTGYYSIAVNVTDFYVVWVNCYNESDPSANITSYGVFFTNSDGTDTYAEEDCTNPHIINVSDIPQGDNIALLVNATGYKDRLYYLDITLTGTYFINCYLAPTEAEGETTRLYTIKVIDEYTYPISNVKVTIARYRNETAEYVNVSSDYTDGYGEVTFHLVPEGFYHVNLSKTGYTQTGSKYWRPDPEYYGAYYPKIFQMQSVISEADEYLFWDIITFNASMFEDGTIHVFFTDDMSNTTNAQFYTYESYNGTDTLLSTNTTILSSFDFWVTGVNISRQHTVIIHLNQTNLGYTIKSIIIFPLRDNQTKKEEREEDIESKITGVFGNFRDINIVHLLFVYIPAIVLLAVLGKKNHPEIGIVGCAFWIAFCGTRFNIPPEAYAMAPFIVAIGIILVLVKGGHFKL